MIKAVRGVWRLLDGVGGTLAASTALAVLQAALLVPIGLLVGRAFDDAVPQDDLTQLAVIGGLILLLSLASTGVGLVTRHLALRAVKRAIERLRVRLVERLLELPSSWYDAADAGVVRSTVVQDTERLDGVTAGIAAQLIPAVVIAVGLFGALLWVALIPTLALVVAFPLLLAVGRSPQVALRDRTRDYNTAWDRFSSRVDLVVDEAQLVRTEGTERHELAQAGREAGDLNAAGLRLSWLQFAAGQAAGVVTTAVGIAVLLLGAALVAKDELSLGSLFAFYALVAPLRGQVGVVLGVVPAIVSGGESLERLERVLEAGVDEHYTGTRVLDFRGELALRDVHFGFSADRPVLCGIDLQVRPGEVVGLAGVNGAGKTTLWRLALGLYAPQAGGLLADGVPYEELDIRALRRQVAVVPQRPVLLPGTVRENIAYGDLGAPPERILEAARQATADAVAAGLTDGYDTAVGDAGRLLSGGQAQRIATARALLRRPRLLVLDEPTSNLDAASTTALLANLRELPWRPAVLLVSHDPRVLGAADRVVTLEDGRVV